MMQIYVVQDPRDYEVRYVGRTGDLKQRRAAHVSGSGQTAALARELRAIGMRPLVQSVETCDDNIAAEREAYWIAHYRVDGRLLNRASVTARKPQDLRHRSVLVRLSLLPGNRPLFAAAADSLAVDLSNFARIAMMEKVDRMRAEGKKL